MAKFIVDGEVVSGSTSYASAIACKDANGGDSTVQAELDAVNDVIDGLNEVETYRPNNGLSLYKSGKTVYNYSSLSGLDTATKVLLDPIEKFLPVCAYALFPVYSVEPPYAPIGSCWIKASGEIQIFKPNGITSIYIGGSYICRD